MNQTPEQFRVRCLDTAQKVRKEFPAFSESLVRLAENVSPQRPTNDTQVLREFDQRRGLKEITRF